MIRTRDTSTPAAGAATPPSPPTSDPRPLLAALLERAGRVALDRRHRLTPAAKADGSEVTDADRACEEVLVDGLRRAWPDATILGEEGAQVSGSRGVWYVDPIDGTSAYIEGLAHWGPTIAYAEGDVLEIGAFHQPRLREHWYAARGQGAWRDDVRLAPAPMVAVGSHDSLYLPSRFHRGMPIYWTGKVRALGCTAAHLAMVAAGGAAATIVPRWAEWDVGCGLLLVREAGLHVVDLTGAPMAPMKRPGAPFAAGDPLALRHLIRRNPLHERTRVERDP